MTSTHCQDGGIIPLYRSASRSSTGPVDRPSHECWVPGNGHTPRFRSCASLGAHHNKRVGADKRRVGSLGGARYARGSSWSRRLQLNQCSTDVRNGAAQGGE
jgi:hypothetical protein